MPINDLTASVRQLSHDVGGLGDDTRQLRRELSQVKRELRRQVLNTRMTVAGAFLLLVAIAVGAFVVSLDNRRAIAENNLRWCPLLLTLGPRPGAPPPAGTAVQREYASETRRLISELSEGYGCRR